MLYFANRFVSSHNKVKINNVFCVYRTMCIADNTAYRCYSTMVAIIAEKSRRFALLESARTPHCLTAYDKTIPFDRCRHVYSELALPLAHAAPGASFCHISFPPYFPFPLSSPPLPSSPFLYLSFLFLPSSLAPSVPFKSSPLPQKSS